MKPNVRLQNDDDARFLIGNSHEEVLIDLKCIFLVLFYLV